MDSLRIQAAYAARGTVRVFTAIALAVTCFAGTAHAHAQSPAASAESTHQSEVRRTFHLTYANVRALNEVESDLHAMLPKATIVALDLEQAISVRGTPEDVEEAGKIIADLDQPNKESRQTFFLTHISDQHELNDIQTDLRNLLPNAKIYGVATQLAISVEGTVDDVEEAHKLIAQLDRPRPVYRLTYTITNTDNGKPAGVQHVDLVVSAQGGRTTFRQGTKVPIVTAAPAAANGSSGASSAQEFQYIDVGLEIKATLTGSAGHLSLHSEVEESSIAAGRSSIGAQDPAIDETVLDGDASLTEGKPLALGSLDLPGGTGHQEIQVVAEQVR